MCGSSTFAINIAHNHRFAEKFFLLVVLKFLSITEHHTLSVRLSGVTKKALHSSKRKKGEGGIQFRCSEQPLEINQRSLCKRNSLILIF